MIRPVTRPIGNSFSKWVMREGLYVIPVSLVILGLIVYPMIFVVRASFQRWLIQAPAITFAGLDNYVRILTNSRIHNSIIVTFLYISLSTVLTFVIPFLIALAMNREKWGGGKAIRGRPLIMTIAILPLVISPAVTASIFRIFFWSYDYGLINFFLRSAGFSRIPWLSLKETALIAVVLTNVWIRGPVALLILNAGMAQIPDELFEASRIDGANRMQEIVYILLPTMMSQVFICVLLMLTSALREFDIPFIMTGGGPLRATEVINLLIYNLTVNIGNIGLASALATVLIGLATVLCLLPFRLYIRTTEGLLNK